MENSYYYNQIEKLNEVVKESTEKKTAFFQHILLVSSSILGIIISLHTTNSQSLHIRLIFILSVILLLLGTLCMAIVLYEFSNIPERARQVFRNEIENAMKDNEKVKAVFVKPKKHTVLCEILAYVFLFLGLISLVTYTVLTSL